MILLALGSNRGKREEFLAQARTVLAFYDVQIVAASGIHETPALMPEGAPDDWNRPFLNQVIRVETHLRPHDLLACVKLIESELGRTPEARWAPREIDIDILAYDDVLVVDAILTLPHPQMDIRRFVLAPLCEIAPDWRHPVLDKTARELLAELPA
ncbi:MAG: 2-amino-4-hydroxy-6-hydroxymethyldihydropteridine diphosphokinase [Alphaproteobacteria bacterium]|nr:2-amino-4-hydroxy-6-hydroxymethyldihydropteridine diphosphokinase [Alphaproteobacteria bacterium]